MAIKKTKTIHEEAKLHVQGGDPSGLVRMTMDQYINNNVDSYGRGYTDGLVISSIIVGTVGLGITLTDMILNRRETGKFFPGKKK